METRTLWLCWKRLCFSVFCLGLCLLQSTCHLAEAPKVAASAVRDAHRPGLVGEYFLMNRLPGSSDRPQSRKPFLVRVDSLIDFQSVEGEFYGSKLKDGFLVRWSGQIAIEDPGVYEFAIAADDGARLYLDQHLLIDHWEPGNGKEKAVRIFLTRGLHDLRLTFYDLAAKASCKLYWTPPNGIRQKVPSSTFWHRPRQHEVSWDLARWEGTPEAIGVGIPFHEAWQRQEAAKYESRKYGAMVSTSLSLGERRSQIVNRAQVVPLGEDHQSGVVFDADTMSLTAGWLEDNLVLKGYPFTMHNGPVPMLAEDKGPLLFTLRNGPGWARDGSFEDPRVGDGPLPNADARYLGHYVFGDNVVFSYEIGTASILEMPAFYSSEGTLGIVRNFEISSAGKSLDVAVADVIPGTPPVIEGNAVNLDGNTFVLLTQAPDGARLVVKEGTVRVKIPPRLQQTTLQITIARGEIAAVLEHLPQEVDLASLTLGGPRKWTETLVTQGVRGPDREAFTIDRLTLPEENPYGVEIKPTAVDFYSDGTRAALCLQNGDVWVVRGIDETLEKLEWNRFAAGLNKPLGLRIVDDTIYVSGADSLRKLVDLNQDGEADFHENICNRWEMTSVTHEFTCNLETDSLGRFYTTRTIPLDPNGSTFQPIQRYHGKLLRISQDGSEVEIIAHGLRTPNGLGVSPWGDISYSDNQGTLVPANGLHLVSDKGYFGGLVDSALDPESFTTSGVMSGKRILLESEATQPLVWLPMKVDRSAGGQTWVPHDRWGLPKGSMLHGSYGNSKLFHVLQDETMGRVPQGGVVEIPLSFSSSAMRLRFNPVDGQLYVCGLKGWMTNGVLLGGFDRVRYTGKSIQRLVRMKTHPNGLELGFSCQLDSELAVDPGSYAVSAVDIAWSHKYGSPLYLPGQRGLPLNEKVEGRQNWEVTSATLLADGKSVFLEIPDMQPVHHLETSYDLESVAGDELIGTLYQTVHTTGSLIR